RVAVARRPRATDGSLHLEARQVIGFAVGIAGGVGARGSGGGLWRALRIAAAAPTPAPASSGGPAGRLAAARRCFARLLALRRHVDRCFSVLAHQDSRSSLQARLQKAA